MEDSSKELEKRAAALDKVGLATLWDKLRNDGSHGWPPGKGLEYLIVRAFELEGAEVTYPFRVPLSAAGGTTERDFEQIDGMLFADGLWCLCESKHTTEPQSVEPLAKLRNQLLRRPVGAVGLAFSVRGFTAPALMAVNYMGDAPILVWTGDDIEWALQKGFRNGLRAKYRMAIQKGMRDYALAGEDLS